MDEKDINTKIAAFGIMGIVIIFLGFAISSNLHPEANVVPAINRSKPQTIIVTNIIHIHMQGDKVVELPPLFQYTGRDPITGLPIHSNILIYPPTLQTNRIDGFSNDKLVTNGITIVTNLTISRAEWDAIPRASSIPAEIMDKITKLDNHEN